MKIKVFEVDFYYFDKSVWCDVNLKITALSRFGLLRCIVKEIGFELAKEMWYKKYSGLKDSIYTNTIEFPIIEKNKY